MALVKIGANVNGVTSDGNTPLHLACFMNQLSTIEKLCELGASQRLTNKNNQRPFDLCITDAARDILKGLMGFEGDAPLPASAVNTKCVLGLSKGMEGVLDGKRSVPGLWISAVTCPTRALVRSLMTRFVDRPRDAPKDTPAGAAKPVIPNLAALQIKDK